MPMSGDIGQPDNLAADIVAKFTMQKFPTHMVEVSRRFYTFCTKLPRVPGVATLMEAAARAQSRSSAVDHRHRVPRVFFVPEASTAAPAAPAPPTLAK